MFLNQMKNYLIFFALTALFFSCSPYQKALKSDDIGLKFHMADSLYNVGKYKRALKLMEQIVPAYRGKPQAEKLMYIYSDTFYELGDFYLAGYQFERFANSYPQSEKVEEAAFKGAKSFYQLSPRYSLDQKDTHIALEKLQNFINKFPDSEYMTEANLLVSELTAKLEKKRFEVAKQYYKLADHNRDYNSAIKALDNFILDHPGSEFREEAHFLKFKAAYDFALRSVSFRVEERLITSRGYYNTFIRNFPESEFRPEADEIKRDIENRLENKQV
jgi:outer membrane protein assembly factor BamD